MRSRRSETAATVGRPDCAPRRRFDVLLEWAIRGFLTLWLVAALGIIAAYVTPPRDPLRAADWQLDGGAVESFLVGEPKMIQAGPQPVWVVRLDDRAFTALAAVCEHQHCVLRWNPTLRVFNCPCHHGIYALDGRLLDGPSDQTLRSFFVNVKAGRVRVHLGRLLGGEA